MKAEVSEGALHDRARAIKLLKEVRRALRGLFKQLLERIVEWKQLDRYLESVFVAARKHNERQPTMRREGSDESDPKQRVRALLRQTESWPTNTANSFGRDLPEGSCTS